MEKGANYEVKRSIEMYKMAQERGINIHAITYLVEYHTNVTECSDLESIEWAINLMNQGKLNEQLKLR
jgi:hypothetical protein